MLTNPKQTKSKSNPTKKMPTVQSLFLTFTQATHLPLAMAWCFYRGIGTYPVWEGMLFGIMFHMPAFLTPSIRYRSQLSGGWFAPADGYNRGKRYVPLWEQMRNVFIIGLYAEFMTTASYWAYRGKIVPSLITALPYPAATTTLESALQFVDRFTPEIIMNNPLMRLGLFATFGYVVCYGSLGTLLGQGVEEIQRFYRNWVQSAAALDAASVRPRDNSPVRRQVD